MPQCRIYFHENSVKMLCIFQLYILDTIKLIGAFILFLRKLLICIVLVLLFSDCETRHNFLGNSKLSSINTLDSVIVSLSGLLKVYDIPNGLKILPGCQTQGEVLV